MFRRFFTSRRCLWLAVPLVGGHLGCLALPAVTVAVGAPSLMFVCGQAPSVLQDLREEDLRPL